MVDPGNAGRVRARRRCRRRFKVCDPLPLGTLALAPPAQDVGPAVLDRLRVEEAFAIAVIADRPRRCPVRPLLSHGVSKHSCALRLPWENSKIWYMASACLSGQCERAG